MFARDPRSRLQQILCDILSQSNALHYYMILVVVRILRPTYGLRGSVGLPRDLTTAQLLLLQGTQTDGFYSQGVSSLKRTAGSNIFPSLNP